MRALPLLLAAACARPSPPPPASPSAAPGPATEADIRAVLRVSADAYRREDWPAFLESSRAASRLSPENPDLRYRVARALARAGHPAEAVAELDRLAAMRLAYRVAEHPDLAALRADPGFARVALRMGENLAPVTAAVDELTLDDRDLLVESVALDPASGAFFLSSVHQRKILRVDPAAGPRPRDFLAGADDVWGVFALRVDAARRVLWATTAALPHVRGYTPALAGRSAVLRISLASGAVERRWELPGEHAFGDLTLDAGGRPWISDSKDGGIYRVAGDRLEIAVPPGRLRSPQGIAFSADGQHGWVADYALGLFRFEVAHPEPRPVAHPDDVCVYGMDGLLRAGGALVAMQNGVQPQRVIALRLDGRGERITGADILDMNDRVIEPTGGTLVGDRLYFVAASQWRNFDDDGNLLPAERTSPAIVRRLVVPQ